MSTYYYLVCDKCKKKVFLTSNRFYPNMSIDDVKLLNQFLSNHFRCKNKGHSIGIYKGTIRITCEHEIGIENYKNERLEEEE